MPPNERLVFKFGEWEVDLTARELRVQGAAVPLGGRALEIIEILIRSAGEVVTKDELVHQIWPGALVDDNTIQAQISLIRKSLGRDRVLLKTVSGRGYRLVGDWTLVGGGNSSHRPASGILAAARSAATNIPLAASALIGRGADLEQIAKLIADNRVVTLLGPGGVGKTVLATEVGRQLLQTLKSDVMFVGLVSLSDPDLVSSSIAYTLDLKMRGNDASPAAVAKAIGDRHVVLLVDNCEHLIEAAARTIEALVSQCPHTTVVATSREALGIEGECLYHVPALEVPESDPVSVDGILGHSAIELFIARTRAQHPGFQPENDKLAGIVNICRRLDGLPLAIEFAAARAATLGVEQVEQHLDDRLTFLSTRRTALPRHQTLRATLDWSYELLDDTERRLLRYLSAFPGGFTLEAIASVLDEKISVVSQGIASLVSKSLVVVDSTEAKPRWRLLETVRVYANEKLVEAGEVQNALHSHARFYLELFQPFGIEERLQSALDGIGAYKREVDNLRASLNWAFSPTGDSTLGVDIATAAADFWVTVSLISEARDWATTALENLGEVRSPRTEMILRCSLGFALTYIEGCVPPAREALTNVLTLARKLTDFEFQQRAAVGLFLFYSRSVALSEALAFAHSYEVTAKSRDVASQAIGTWLVGIAKTYTGAHQEAGQRLEWAFSHYPKDRRRRDIIRFGGDLFSSALSHNTVNLLSRGLTETAVRTAHRAIEVARGSEHPAVLAVALSWAAAYVFLNVEQLDEAENHSQELLAHANKFALRPYYAVGLCVKGAVATERGEAAEGVEDLKAGLAEMERISYLLFYPLFRTRLAIALSADGRDQDAENEIDANLEYSSRMGFLWFVPEILRVKGELLQKRASPNFQSIDGLFRRSIKEANARGALYWELSAATSLADLWFRQGKLDDARVVLSSVYARVAEGLDMPRVKRARTLLSEISG